MQQYGLVLRTSTDALDLRPDAIEVSRGRRFVSDACAGLGPELAYTAALLTSELVTHALLHGAGPIRILVTPEPGVMRVDVSMAAAASLWPPVQRDAGPRGRGLSIVERLADSWGVSHLRDGGTSMWFALRTDG